MTADSGNPPRNACGCIQESQFNFPEKNGWILDSQIRLDGGYHQMTSGFHHRWWILDGGEWRIPKLDASNLIPPRPPVSAALPSPPPWREAPAPRTWPQGFPAQQWHPRPHRYRWSHRHIMCLGWRSSGENLWGWGISRGLWWFNHH